MSHMNKKHLKPIAALILLVAILGAFAYYVSAHPAIINAISHINPWLFAELLVCYAIFILWLMGVYNAILRLCAQPLPVKENLLLTIYSTLANFFLPLQSGPGVRAGYLKKRHQIPISRYIYASLVYFSFYAIISAGLLFVASTYYWLAIPAIISAGLISLLIINIFKRRLQKKEHDLALDISPRKLCRLALMSLGQLSTQTLIYGLEIKSLTAGGSIRQIISYSGAANFSIFVSITPGAIGFREAFLQFSQKLHNFSTNIILGANLIDRGVFIIFLGLLFVFTVAVHARDRLKL